MAAKRCREEESASFLKRRSKKLWLLRHHPLPRTCLNWRGTQQTKVFWFFFSKKNLLTFFYLAPLLLTLAVVTPPWQNPDEFAHMLRAVEVAHGGLFGYRAWGTTGGESDPAIYDAYKPILGVAMHPEQRVSRAALAASGAVGSVAGQLAKRAGGKVIGVAGGADKCLFVQETLGFDACIDHRAGSLETELDVFCPEGIDVYFENVGGALQKAVWPRLKVFARMIMCGMVAEYNAAAPEPGPSLMAVVAKRLRVEGLIVSDKPHRFAEWRALAAPWVADGSLKYREDVVDGLENASAAFIGLLEGRNFGKLLVRVGPDAI